MATILKSTKCQASRSDYWEGDLAKPVLNMSYHWNSDKRNSYLLGYVNTRSKEREEKNNFTPIIWCWLKHWNSLSGSGYHNFERAFHNSWRKCTELLLKGWRKWLTVQESEYVQVVQYHWRETAHCSCQLSLLQDQLELIKVATYTTDWCCCIAPETRGSIFTQCCSLSWRCTLK